MDDSVYITQMESAYKIIEDTNNMTNTELVLNMLAEVSTTEISRNENPNGLNESKYVAKRGGNIAGNARKDLESQLGKKVISKHNSNNPDMLDE